MIKMITQDDELYGNGAVYYTLGYVMTEERVIELDCM